MNRPYYGWVVVSACFVGSFVVFGLSYSFGVFFEEMLDEFGHSRGVTSLAFSIQTVALYIGAGVIGAVIDRYGSRTMLAVGIILLCSGLFLTSIATSLFVLILAYGILTGLGMSIVYIVSYATVPRWFDRRQGFAAGVASSGLGFGMLVVAPVATWLIDAIGWRETLVVLAIGAALLLTGVFLLIRDDPNSAGITPPPNELTEAGNTREYGSWRDQFDSIYRTARRPSFLLLSIGWVLIYTTLYVTFAHLVVHVVELGFTRTVGATALSIIGLTTALGRISIGYLGDVTGRVRTFVLCSVVMGLSTALLPLATSAVAIFAFAGVYGLAYGGNGALLAPLTADLFGRVNINALFGLVSFSFAVSGLFAPPLAGAGYDILGSYDLVFVVSGLAAVVGAACVTAANRVQ